MKKLFSALILSVALTPAWAEWIWANQSDDYNLLINRSSIVKSVDTARGWIMYDRLEGSNSTPASVVGLYEADCKKGLTRLIQFTSYSGQMGRGRSLGSSDIPSSWTYPIPQSLEDTIFKTFCSRR